MSRVFARKSLNWAFVVILMFAVAGWGAFNVTIRSTNALGVLLQFRHPEIQEAFLPLT